jgi:hypothetical protein
MLMTVAANGSEAFAEFLLSRGANINARTQSVKDAFCMVMVVAIICSSLPYAGSNRSYCRHDGMAHHHGADGQVLDRSRRRLESNQCECTVLVFLVVSPLSVVK